MKLLPILSIVLTLSSGSLAWYGFGKRGLVDNEPTRNTKGPEFEERWFRQMLDHYDPSSPRTWKQRYFVNDQFYEEGGPIFLMVSGEQVAHPAWIADDASLETYLAKKFGAKVFFLEHRYYGKSRPTETLSTYNLAFLSADQALADTAYFIEGMQRSHNIPRSSKWILFGASYAGSLVSWMRAKYPHLVHGAVANSAPLVAEIDFKDFYIVVENSLRKHSPSCVAVLSQAYKSIYPMLADKAGRLELENMFNVCGSHFEENTVINDIINFYEGIIDIATEVVFNNDTYSLTIEKACSVLEDEEKGEPLTRLVLVNKLLLKERGQECLPLEKYNDTIDKLKQTSWPDGDQWDRRWIYQVCTEFGWFQTTSGEPFEIPTSAIPIELYTKLCTDTFGVRFEKMLILGVERTNMQFGGLDIADSVTNIAFVHGSNDPWHAAGVVNSTNPRSPVIYVEGAGHCPLIHPPRNTDNPPLAEGKQKVENLINLWLNHK